MRHGRANIPQSGHSGFRFIRPCRVPFGALSCCSRSRSAAARSIWDRGERTRKSRSLSPRSRPTISAPAASTIPRATPPAARCSPSPARPKRRSPNSIARSRSIPTMCRPSTAARLIYQGEKQHQQAIADFTAANGLSPQKVEPLLGRATSYLALDKAKEAAADLDEAVQADPNSANAWSARGQAYERLGDKAKAAESYGRALNIRPKTTPRAAALPASAAKQASKPGRSFSKRRLTSAARRGTSTSPPTACLRRPTCARARAAASPRHADRADG